MWNNCENIFHCVTYIFHCKMRQDPDGFFSSLLSLVYTNELVHKTTQWFCPLILVILCDFCT